MKNFSFICPLLLLIFNFSFQSSAQRIYFSDTTNIWKWYGSHMPDPNGDVMVSIPTCISKDSIVEWNGKFYTLIECDELLFDALVRDDTAANRVYIKPIIDTTAFPQLVVTDTNEFVYMDYNLDVGDSLIMPLVEMGSSDSVSIHKISEVDSIFIDNIWYKKYWVTWLNADFTPYNHFALIEGVGPLPMPVSEWAYDLVCFSNQGVVPPVNFWNCTVSINEIIQKSGRFIVYPIPTTHQLTIRSNVISANDYQVRLTNLLGQTLVVSSFKNELTINISEFSAGLYLLQILGNEGWLQSEKVYVIK